MTTTMETGYTPEPVFATPTLDPVISWALAGPLAESSSAVDRAVRFYHWYTHESPWLGFGDVAAYRAAWNHWMHLTGFIRLQDWWLTPPTMRRDANEMPVIIHDVFTPTAYDNFPTPTRDDLDWLRLVLRVLAKDRARRQMLKNVVRRESLCRG